MANPPKDIGASELWLKLQETPAPSEIVDFPRRDPRTNKFIGQLRLIVLDMEQIDLARIRAMERFRNSPRVQSGDEQTQLGREILGDMVARESLLMACHSVDPLNPNEDSPRYRKIFMKVEDLGKLSRDELASLFMAYTMTQEKFGPHERDTTKEECDAWVNRLVEGGSTLPLAQLGSQALVELTQLLAVRVYALSQALRSQSSSLPDTLALALSEWGCATSSSGEQQDESIESGSNEPIRIEDAILAARVMTGQ